MRFLLFFCLILPTFAYAASDPFASSNGKHDKKQPIDVTSDSLEVLQNDNKAIFKGNVIAIQGDVRLKADIMTVYYDKKGEKKEPAAKKQNNATGAIKKIDADGSVFLSTPQETASGATGTYDVEHQEIHLNTGVVLTRDKNVLKGDHLVYNFDSGKSKLTSDGGQVAGQKGSSRVHALFVPEKNDKVKP